MTGVLWTCPFHKVKRPCRKDICIFTNANAPTTFANGSISFAHGTATYAHGSTINENAPTTFTNCSTINENPLTTFENGSTIKTKTEYIKRLGHKVITIEQK